MSSPWRSSIIAATLMSTAVLYADPETEFSGYYKNLLSLTRMGAGASTVGVEEDEVLVDDYHRLRFKLKSSWGDWLDVRVDYEVSAASGDGVEMYRAMAAGATPGVSSAGSLTTPVERPRFLDLESDISEGIRSQVRHGIDRMRVRFTTDRMDLSVGRQSVGWGSGLFWSPVDIFTSFSPTEIDRDVQIGLDVVRVTFWPWDETEVDAVVEPLDNERHGSVDADDSAAAARVKTQAGEYDVSVCGGYVAGDWVCGGDFSGYLGDAGFRGEALYAWVKEAAGDNYLKLMLGVDYSFQAKFAPTVMVEYFYNGLGRGSGGYVEELLEPAVQRLFERGTAFSLGRHYLGGSLSFQFTSLIGCQGRTIVNLEDGSANQYLSLLYSVSDNTELIVGTSLAIGGVGTEFGGWSAEQVGTDFENPDLYFAYFKAYF